MAPNVEEHAVIATVKGLLYPALIICGMITEPIPAVSAVLDPEIPANSMLATILTMARPAWTRPTSARARFMIRSVIEVELHKMPTI